MDTHTCFPLRRISLVEVLIAVTVGGLLLSVLFPVYQKSTGDADLARCRSIHNYNHLPSSP